MLKVESMRAPAIAVIVLFLLSTLGGGCPARAAESASQRPDAGPEGECPPLELRDDEKYPPLFQAVAAGDVRTVTDLLAAGEDVNQEMVCLSSREAEATPLFYARTLEMIDTLVAHGATLDVRTKEGRTPLMWAVLWPEKNCRVHAVKRFLQLGVDLEAQDWRGETPLMLAARTGAADVVEILLGEGADVHARDRTGGTVLYDATSSPDPRCLELLIQHGADVDVTFRGRGIVHAAVSRRRRANIEVLIQAGASVNTRDPKDGETPLHDAARANSVWGWDPIEGVEVEEPSVEMVRVLLEAGAKVNVRDAHGRTPIAEAAWAGTRAVARLLLDHGADPLVEDEDGTNAIEWAAGYAKCETLEILAKATFPKGVPPEMCKRLQDVVRRMENGRTSEDRKARIRETVERLCHGEPKA